MAKNKARRNKPADQNRPKKENTANAAAEAAEELSADKQSAAEGAAAASAAAEKAAAAEAAGSQSEKAASGTDGSGKKAQKKKKKKKRELQYQVKTKRDAGVIKAYITFTYRVLHPTVSARLMIYGFLVALPGIVFFKDVFWRVFFIAVGVMLILLGLFRQYISLAITKRNDPDYKSGAEFEYNFYEVGADFCKNGECFLELDKYKDITNFYYDDDYYYLAVRSRDFFVIPKDAFTVGDAVSFEEFIYKKSKHTCRWIPDKFSDRMKKRRAQRAVAGKDLYSKDLFK